MTPEESEPRAGTRVNATGTSPSHSKGPDQPSPTSPLLRVENIGKQFPGVRALDNVSLEVRAGEVVALVGENGAGKSTLMKVLCGGLRADSGTITWQGVPVQFSSVGAAKQSGIALIHQELMLAPNLDVAANIFLGSEPGSGTSLRGLRRKSMQQRAQALLERVGLSLSAQTRVSQLSPGQQQLVEIAKAISLNARMLIMDEPTASLTMAEADRLLSIVDDLRRSGMAIIYISHRIPEVLKVADRIVVLRDGQRVGELSAKTASYHDVVCQMVGRELTSWFPELPTPGTEAVLQVDRLSVPGAPTELSFQVCGGEILGVAGLVGSGRTEVARVLFGVDQGTSGELRLAGQRYHPQRPADAIRQGVYLVPEDRKLQGLVLGMAVDANISLPDIAHLSSPWQLNRTAEQRVAADQIDDLAIKVADPGQAVGALSGGNQQKVAIAKWRAMRPRLLILDEPTRGVDVGAKAEIYRQIVGLAEQGIAVLMISSDLEEVLGMSHRVLVMHERRLTGIVSRSELSEQRIAELMTGGAHREDVA